MAAALLAGTYGVSHVIGRAAEPGAEPDVQAPAVAEPSVAPNDPGPNDPGPKEPTVEDPVGDDPADGEPRQVGAVERPFGARRPAASQPFTGPGRPPLPRSTLGPHGSRTTTADSYVALTFDDGPDPRWTPQVLDLLRKYEATATFCVVGQLAQAYPELVRRIADDGHTLCNHTWDHDIGLGSRPAETIRKDLERTSAAIAAAVPGARISYYRQPGGAWTQRVVDVAEEYGMTSLHWAVDPQDWRRPGAKSIASVVASYTAEGAIVLLHDGGGDRHGTVQALKRTLPALAEKFHLDGLPPGIDQPRRHGVELPPKPSQL